MSAKAAYQSSRMADRDLVGGLRVEASRPQDADEPRARMDHHVRRFLEAHWTTPPRRYLRLRPLAYALLDDADHDALSAAIADLALRMEGFLFGEGPERGAEVLTLAAGSGDVAAFLHGDPAEARAVMQRCAEEAAAPPPPDPKPDPNVGAFGFQGMFDARHNVLLASVVWPRDPGGPNRYFTPADFAGFWDVPLETVHERVLATAVGALAAERVGGAPLIYCPVEYSSLSTPQRAQEFLELAVDVPERTLGVKIVNAPNFPQNDRVRDITRRMMSKFRFVDWEVAAGEIEPAWFMRAGLHSVTLATPHEEPDHRVALQRFLPVTSALQANRVRVGVRGLKSAEGVVRCIDARADFLTGAGITHMADEPFTPRRLEPQQLPVRPLEAA